MAFSRRSIVAGIAGGSALVLSAGLWRAMRQPETAFRPWLLEGRGTGSIALDAFRHAILAPNPHNRQPWLIELSDPETALLYCDLEKRLPVTDPYDRQITIGFGTFIELARIAAAERGYALEMTAFPEGEPQPRLDQRPVARLQFVKQPEAARDPLYAQIVKRRSNKQAYDLTRPVSAAALGAVTNGEAEWTLAPERLAEIRALVVEAILIEHGDRAANQESVDLSRIGAAQIDAQPDGIDIGGPMPELLGLAGVLDRESLADPSSLAYRSARDMLRETYGSVPAALWIATPGNSRLDQLEAGRRYVRTNLRATAAGLSMHPQSQALQEYPAMAGPFGRVAETLGIDPERRVQMLARIGYGPPAEPAPRWPVESHIRT